MKDKGYHKLRIILETKAFILLIYRYTEKFPKSEEFGLKSQIRRAAVSVLLNTVEGHRKQSSREFYRFLETADCSLTEVEVALEISHDLQFLNDLDFIEIEKKRAELAAKLVRFMQAVKKNIK